MISTPRKRTGERFTVDWSDAAYPRIRVWTDGEHAAPLTLADAKAEIISHFEAMVAHARDQIRVARSTRAADVLRAAS